MTLTPNEAECIAYCLRKRVKPVDAEEGANLMMLAAKVVSHFAPQPVDQQSSQPGASAPADKT